MEISEKQITARNRYHAAKAMRISGLTFSEIGRSLGCGPTRARQIIDRGDKTTAREAALRADPFRGISVRTESCLRRMYAVDGPVNDEVILRASAEIDLLLQEPNFGKKSAHEILAAKEILLRKEARKCLTR